MAYHPWVNVTSDLVSRINIKSGAYLLFFFLRQEFQIWCVDESMDGRVSHSIFGSM